MPLFAIGDLHLSLSEDKPMDVFSGWNDYVERLEENWRRLVTDNDTVVIAGDISWAMKLEDAVTDFRFIDRLPGKKIFLKGNHDYWWGTKSKIEKLLADNELNTISILFNNAYVCGDYAVCGTRGWFLENDTPEDIKVLNREVGRLKTSIEAALGTGMEPVIMDVLVGYGVKKCYYGHIHGRQNFRLAFEGGYKGIEFKLISCDRVGFTPVLVR